MSKLVKRFSRWQDSIAKRLCWRSHLEEARASLRQLTKELPTLDMMLAIPYVFQGKGYYKTLGLKQNMLELRGLAELVRDQHPETACEIGTFKGGTLFVWCQLAQPNAHIISIDLPGGEFGGGYYEKSIPFFDSFRRPGQVLECLRGSSHDADMRQQFEKKLAGRKLDFLFIDGDHSYDGVKKDFEFYSRFVRKGGLVGFHDIVKREELPDIGVYRFWNEIKEGYRHHEFIETSAERRTIGIGALYLD